MVTSTDVTAATDAMAVMANTIDEKLADLIRRLGSNHDGEVVATARAIQRVLKSDGRDLHSLADAVAKNGNELSETEMSRLFDAGYEAGLRSGREEAKRDAEFYAVGDEGDPDWRAMVRYCFGHKARLRKRDLGFIESMARQIRVRSPTELQQPWLIDLYRRLGGK
jgi:hypothetical protein